MTGTWAMTLASAVDSGTVTADGADGSANMHFKMQGAGGCAVEMFALRAGTSIVGNYTASACMVPDSGKFTVTKR
jgi:hypothetical protein